LGIVLSLRCQDHRQGLPFHFCRALDFGDICQVRGDSFYNREAEFGVSDLSPAKHQRHFHLVAFTEEPARMPSLGVEVVVLDPRAELHFLEFDDVLLLFRDACLLGLFKLELAVVHDPDDGGTRGRCDFNQIESGFFGQCHRSIDFHDS
jgi:hypothetical protein